MAIPGQYTLFYYDINFTIKDPSDGSVTNITKYIKELYLLDDYINNISTIVKISFITDQKVYDLLYNKGESLDYRISISSKPIDSEMLLFDEVYMNNMQLKPLVKPTNVLKTKVPDHSIVESREEYKNISIEMTFIPVDVYKTSRNVYNNLLSNVNSYTAAAYIIKDVTDRTILLELPDNTNTYEQIFIPPNNFASSLRFIQQHYGIYATGISIYFKNHYLYVKNRMNNSKTPAMRDKKPGNVVIKMNKYTDSGANNIANEGTKYDDNGNYYEYMIDMNNVTFHNNTLVNEELLGNYNIIFDRNFDSIHSNTYSKDNTVTETKRKYYMNYMSNPMLPTEMFYTSINKPESISISYTCANLNMWSIENTYKVTIFTDDVQEDIYVNKKYQVYKNEMLFKGSNGNFTLVGTALLNEI